MRVSDSPQPAVPAPPAACCAVLELRHYTLRPGVRDQFVTLFDREFLETQEAVGMHVVAQFRDVDRPDAFTWLRGFPDMPSRAASLHAFYDGPVWAAHRAAANGMIEDSDDVRLLRPARPGSGLVAAATRCRSVPSSTCRPRLPAERKTVPNRLAEASRKVRSRVRWPRGEMPPTT